ncbi:S-adenosyl-L-methionine-dependent methyltransferase [Coccomyxa subellipsoidea C-169]|uniref:S-adenosyl-L-methionine-dependent methyltransferase n=1 Tax=Coccomyxa subellipsoidea (strain C-169) TaxID=574566 RepID=I0YYN7_COCSC|nr:S-adenosyl-L-methionine-dependent methyltransferase [Coccomyxa subellipsoidea C-169]EIE23506.1 S-adenosyl-L-methionine-dependent methyltransferase [Coccomyxa subellipsoidea C-169]|eukprot:XP_005648050.1 S-adenosyl-L-methionine-dependent methyltransferase [Coccomyxa subellipsoidea C-169]
MAGFGHLFRNQASSYAAYRPTYPSGLYEVIYDFAKLASYDSALDLATGSGQAAAVLSRKFQRVVALDQSEQQLKEAVRLPNIEYGHASAEETGVPGGSVNLVTVAQALHWFDLPAFYREVRRVLRPEGAFAAWGYDLCEFKGNDAANAALEALYNGTLGPYWSDRRRLIEKQYKGLEPGPEHFGEVKRVILDTMSAEMSVSALIGYLSSWSAYATYREQHPDLPDPLIKFKGAYKAAFGFTSDEDKATVYWPLFVVLAKDPHPLK